MLNQWKDKTKFMQKLYKSSQKR